MFIPPIYKLVNNYVDYLIMFIEVMLLQVGRWDWFWRGTKLRDNVICNFVYDFYSINNY